MAKIPGLNTWANRTTRQFLQQISSGGMEQRFPAESFHDTSGEPISNANWIHAPDLSAVTGVPNKYWIITGDVITEMNSAAKAAVDAATLNAQRDSSVVELDGNENTLRQVVRIIMAELNILRAQHGLQPRTLQQLRNAIRNGYGS